MHLSRSTLKNNKVQEGREAPAENIFNLPERVLQFGTGVLLRGLPDYFINKANNRGIFNGRVVVVKSTTGGGTEEFTLQDCLYTHCIRGVENGAKVEENIINASVSRVLSAIDNWNDVLQCAENPLMEIVISNTTEVGISMKADDNIHAAPPVSFPAKLLAFLIRRFEHFRGEKQMGLVIVPTELIPENGRKLKEIVLELAELHHPEADFLNWLENANHFCNSLVDRIVPGKLPQQEKAQIEAQTGLTDDLMIMSESYSLWAIETSEPVVAEKLSFSKADKGVVIAKNIQKFRELKLRLLNGTHTFSCGLAFLSGFTTVKQAMEDEAMATYIQQLMQIEIAPAIPYDINEDEATAFSNKVLDRFRNPHIEHKWIAITVQYSTKMKMRNVPLLHHHYAKTSSAPVLMAKGFAAHILFMKCTEEDGKYYGLLNHNKYPVQDDNAAVYARKWNNFTGATLVTEILKDQDLWGANLTAFPGFAASVTEELEHLMAGKNRLLKDVQS